MNDLSAQDLTHCIKEKALALGFAACGIAAIEELKNEASNLEDWLQKGFQAEMSYMERNKEKRLNPSLLEPGAESIIVVLIPYISELKQKHNAPRIARYAQTVDYHEPIRSKLYELLEFIKDTTGDNSIKGRAFTDSAPILERAWAVKAGLGWQAKNGMLINLKLGSYFFIGELLINLKLEPDQPFTTKHCGQCQRCIQACPAQAIVSHGVIDANRCISYRTIEEKKQSSNESLHGRLFGCDICQEVCPWNTKPLLTPPHWLESITNEWPSSIEEWKTLGDTNFKLKFGKSALARTGYSKIIQNLDLI